MALTKVFLNQKFTVTLVCKTAAGVVIDLTGRTCHFYYKDPSGNETIDTAPTTVDEDGEVTHEFAAAVGEADGDLDEEGVWQCKAFIDTDEVPSTKYNFEVVGLWDR